MKFIYKTFQDVLLIKKRLERETSEARKHREEAQSHIDGLRIQQEHLQETIIAMSNATTMSAQVEEWQIRLTRARLQGLQLQRRVHDLEDDKQHLQSLLGLNKFIICTIFQCLFLNLAQILQP